MRTRFYMYTFSDNSMKMFSSSIEAEEHAESNSLSIVKHGHSDYREALKNIRTTKDGFKSGWHPGLGEYVRGQKHYSQLLNEKGLTEVGKENVEMCKQVKSPSMSREELSSVQREAGFTERETTYLADKINQSM